ncbi:restriction endonuclease subunit S [Aestuariimicrobium sp. p3-SID1156]|nr:restriction endonuclease subunit S [Aestuariimicrobium sp. p3-SID1156]
MKTSELQDAQILSTEEHLTDSGLQNSSAKVLPRGTVLMAMYGATVGKLGWLGIDASCNQAACALIPDPTRCDARWLFYALLRHRPSLISLANGAAQQNLNAGLIRRFSIPAPQLSTQRAIAEVLGALDDKIAANKRLVQTASELMSAHAEQLPTDATLRDLAELSRVQVSAGDLSEWATVWHYSLPAFDADILPERESGSSILSGKFKVSNPSVLLSKLNPRFPRVWDVPDPEDSAAASTEFLVLEPKSLPTSALWAVLANSRTTAYLSEHAAGTSGSHQRVRPDVAMDLPAPAAEHFADELVDLLRSLGARIQVARRESRTLAELRDTLLPKLMDGTLRVKDAERLAEEKL